MRFGMPEQKQPVVNPAAIPAKAEEQKPDSKDEELKKKSLGYSISDGSFYNVMVNFGERFVVPFAVKINATAQQIGFISSVPQLASSLFQPFSANIADKLKKRKRLVLIAALLQALVWIPMILVVILFRNPWLLLLFFTFYVVFGSFISPLWSSWMGDLVNEKERGRFFGKRNMIAGFVGFVAMLVAGFVLHLFADSAVFYGFMILFAVALFARLASLSYLARMHEPQYAVTEASYFSLRSFIKKMPFNNFGRFVIFSVLISLVANIASPFFVVYMLRDLNFNYLMFTVAIAAQTIIYLFAMNYWGKYSDIFGNKAILSITGILIPFTPMLWLVSGNFYYIVFVFVLTGFIWAGFDLCVSNYFFDAVTPQRRARCIAFHNTLSGFAVFIGAAFGGFLVGAMAAPLIFPSKFQFLFFLSGILRLAVVLAFIPVLKEVRVVEPAPKPKLFFRLYLVEPPKELFYLAKNQAHSMKNLIKGTPKKGNQSL